MSSESPGLPSWALLWVLSSLGAQGPALGDDVQRGDTRSPHISQGHAGGWQTLGHELLLPGLTISPAPVLGILHSWRLPSSGGHFWSEVRSWASGEKKNDAIPALSSPTPALMESWVSVVFVSASFSLAKEIIVTNSSSYVFSSVSGIRSFSGKQK